MKDEETIVILNTLISMNNERIKGFKKSSEETEVTEMKMMYSGYRHTSKLCKTALKKEVYKLGSTPQESTPISGKFLRIWMFMKNHFTNRRKKTLMTEMGSWRSIMVIDTYHTIIRNNLKIISAEHQRLLNLQYDQITAEHDALMRYNHRKTI